MITVGLTGGIGSGKTYVSTFFKRLNIPVYNSDTRAKALMIENVWVREQLIEAFGKQVYINNTLNRAFLARKVFSSEHNVKIINGIVHPAVDKDFKLWQNQNSSSPYVIKEAAILIETGIYKKLDKLIVVVAPKAVRLRRVCDRDKLTAEQVTQRMDHQLSDEERIAYADFVIENDGMHLVDKQVNKIHNTLITE